MRIHSLFAAASGLAIATVTFALAPVLVAQQPQAAAPAQTPRAAAPHDLTGIWVSVVTEDWLWRMTTPPKGDFTSIPLSDEGRRVAGLWDPASDGDCRAYGAAGLMRMPTRLRISWQGDDALKVESDAGQQVRLLQFNATPAPAPRTLQGSSAAEWEPFIPRGARGFSPALAALKVVTTNLSEGWLRKNGIPYSDATVLTEHWDRVAFPNGDVWLIVSQYVDDPRYLTGPYTTSMHFKLEPDDSKWHPTPCRQA